MLNSYSRPAENELIAMRRLKQVRKDWLQLLLFENFCEQEFHPAWAEKLIFKFAKNYSVFSQHARARLKEFDSQKKLLEFLLWQKDRPGLLGYVDPSLLTEIFSDSKINLDAAWKKNYCGELTQNYLLAHTQPPTLVDTLPANLHPWW